MMMTKTIQTLLSISLLAGLFAGCQDTAVEAPSFEVQPAQLTYKVGETPMYTISGYADYISYYSGDKVDGYPTLLGNRYEYKDRVSVDGKAYLQFVSTLKNTDQQQGTLSVLVSSDFNGVYDPTAVSQATWTDITDRVTLSDGSSSGEVSSGRVDITDFQNKPFFLAFRYAAQAGTQQPTWTIKKLSVVYHAQSADNAVATTDTFTVATLNPAWRAVDVGNATQKWSSSTSQLRIAGGNATAEANEDWVITRDYYLNRVPTDKAVPFKTYTDAMPSVYEAKPYTRPGQYKVTFVASNADSKDQFIVNKSFIITVVP